MFKEPYRLFFPLGTFFLLWGALIWLPLIWTGDHYPVLAHRYLMLNGFTGCFIGGFLMTAVPKFSQTDAAKPLEVLLYLFVTLVGLIPAYVPKEECVFLISSLQPLLLLIFLFSRITKRKMNPPYSFAFIFVGLFLWFISGILSIFIDNESFKQLHYEGAITSIILGVGSRLIPGILGHVEIVQSQRTIYERPISIFQSIPKYFLLLIVAFVASYFLSDLEGAGVRVSVVTFIGLFYWRLWKRPVVRSILSWCIWISSWLIVLSSVMKVIWIDWGIHVGHAFFINGIVLLSLLIATRVLQSHGPKLPELEDRKVLAVITTIIILAGATRVSAYLLPEQYLSHLAYSSIILSMGIIIWGFTYLRYVLSF